MKTTILFITMAVTLSILWVSKAEAWPPGTQGPTQGNRGGAAVMSGPGRSPTSIGLPGSNGYDALTGRNTRGGSESAGQGGVISNGSYGRTPRTEPSYGGTARRDK